MIIQIIVQNMGLIKIYANKIFVNIVVPINIVIK